MKNGSKIILTAAVVLLCATTSRAVIFNITNSGGSLVYGIPMGSLPNNNPDTMYGYLVNTIIPGYNSIAPASPPNAPTPLPAAPPESSLKDYGSVSEGNSTVDITGYTYAALHYGGGTGGGLAIFYYLGGTTGNYQFPGKSDSFIIPTPTPGNPNKTSDIGNGGISSIRLWGENQVSDSGSVLILLGASLGLLAFLRSKKDR